MILVSRLAISTSALWLPWLIEGLKVEDIEVPVKSSTDTLLEEGKSIRCTCNCSSVVCSTYQRSQRNPGIGSFVSYHRWAILSLHSRVQLT